MYGKRENVLDVNPTAPVDHYLVFTGPKSAGLSSRGALRPFCIESVYLFDAERLHTELLERGVKLGVASSVRAVQWDAAEIYPRSRNQDLVVSEPQRRKLAMFAGD